MVDLIPAEDRLESAFLQALAVARGTDFRNVAYGSTPGWDSVAHMSLIAEIELAFDIMLDTDDVIAMSSYTKAVEILSSHGIHFGE